MTLIWDPFLSPVALVLLFAPPALAIVGATVFGVRGGDRRAIVRGVRRILAVALLFAAAMGPSYGTTTTKVTITDVDVFFVMDTTTSSNAEDIGDGRTRLDLMKEDAVKVMGQYAGSRYSLITFDSVAITRLPLVRDPIALTSLLDSLDVELTQYASGGDIGEAADELAKRLAESQKDHPERAQLVFYFGDGEQTASGSPTSLASAAGTISDGAVFGYGTSSGGRMRENDYVPNFYGVPATEDDTPPPYVKDGALDAISRIDENNLRTVASQLGVSYQHRDALSDPTVPRIDDLLGEEKTIDEAQIALRWYWVPAIPAFLILIVDVLLALRNLGELLAARKGVRA